MITELIMPKLGQTMEEGTIVEWFKEEGEEVKRGDLLFTLESDKASLDVEATGRGFMRKIIVQEGETVPVLTVIGLITGTADEDIGEHVVSEPGKPEATAPLKEGTPLTVAATSAAEPPGSGDDRITASPRARKLAAERGIDLSIIKGTGPEDRITEQDVLNYLESRSDALPGATVAAIEPLTGLRGIIAERIASSARSTARVTLVSEADATGLVELKTKLKEEKSEEWGFEPGFNELLGFIVSRALVEFPYMNARLSRDGMAIEHLKEINLGVAVDTERGLVVPVLHNTAEKDPMTFGRELRSLIEATLAGELSPDDFSGGTFTMTNLGSYGIDAFTPVINPPEAAVLGIGRIHPGPIVHEEEIVIRQMLTLSLVFDHRLMDGAPAARFLQRIVQLIEEPDRLFNSETTGE